MELKSIDMNADVGEGIGNEAELMPYLSSCNIACGGHAGDLDSMNEVVALALQHNVKIGAHPSYPDPDNFGRSEMDISCAALYRSIKAQIGQLRKVIEEHHHAHLHHVKPHGALYNVAAKDCDTATIIIEVMKSMPLPAKLYVPYGSLIAEMAKEEGIPITYEAFADRNYNDDLSLVSRSEANAVITDPVEMYAHVIRMVQQGEVKTISGKHINIKADTFCIHGDNPKAIELVKLLSENLAKNQILIQ